MSQIKYIPLSVKEETKKAQESPTPYVLRLSKGAKKLVCFGVKHTSNYGDKQFELFKGLLEEFDPEIVLVETDNHTLENANKFFNELGYIIPAAKQKNIKIKGVDLNPLGRIVKFSQKYDPKDIILLRALFYLDKPGEKANLKIRSKEIIKIISHENDFSEIYKKSGLNEDSFLEALRDYVQRVLGKKLEELTEKDSLLPSPLEDRHVLNKICRDIDFDRDSFMLMNLEAALKQYKGVFYILGKNHIIRQEKTIRQIFEELK